MHLFYCNDISANDYVLNEDESKHCVRVLRLEVGDVIYLTNGAGSLYKAQLTSVNPKKCSVTILETKHNYCQRNYYLHIAIAPTKNIDRIEWFLEKATEIGIDEITPLVCKRSERTVIKPERLNKIIENAMKQSLKAYHPKLNELTKFDAFVKQPFNGNKLIAHCLDTEKNILKNGISLSNRTLMLIGPEGDFTPEEIKLALNANFNPVSLGESRLRTETAALYCCAAISVLHA